MKYYPKKNPLQEQTLVLTRSYYTGDWSETGGAGDDEGGGGGAGEVEEGGCRGVAIGGRICGNGLVSIPFRTSWMIARKKTKPKKSVQNNSAVAATKFGCTQSSELFVLCRVRYRSAGRLSALPDAKNAAPNPAAILQANQNHESRPHKPFFTRRMILT